MHFDEAAAQAVELAYERAKKLRRQGVAPEHLLIGLLAVPGGMAVRIVARLCGSSVAAERAIAEDLLPGVRWPPYNLGFTGASARAVARAADEATALGDARIGTEHLLLGLLTATQHTSVRRLLGLGVDYDAARAEIARLRTEAAS
jgi:ATP-dependent Clp protease ATP-binding subunit ClpA